MLLLTIASLLENAILTSYTDMKLHIHTLHPSGVIFCQTLYTLQLHVSSKFLFSLNVRIVSMPVNSQSLLMLFELFNYLPFIKYQIYHYMLNVTSQTQ